MKWIPQIIGLILFLSFSALAAGAQKCDPSQVNQQETRFKSLEFSVKEAEVDFKRVDRVYQEQLTKSITRSADNMKKAGIDEKRTLHTYEQLLEAIENFNSRPEEELETTVTDLYSKFIRQLNANPNFNIEMVNANYQLYKDLKKEQTQWQRTFSLKSKLFADYVDALNDYNRFQKACRVGKYEAQN